MESKHIQKPDMPLYRLRLPKRFKLNAKSIMGIFSLDLSTSLIMMFESKNDKEIAEIEHDIS